ncbi:major capsid protein P2 [Photobacterium damselae]|uniref:major capsid protein P2 n=1 Tax=Photobacterium damselae TaxID=38293 RepID=UPI00406914FB
MQNCTHRKLQAFSGVVPGGRAVLDIPTGQTYEQIILKTNLDKTKIRRIEFKINDDKILDVTPEHLHMLQKYHGRPVEDGVFVLPFSDFNNIERGAVSATALVTQLGEKIQLTVEIEQNAGERIQIDTYAIVSPPQAKRVLMPRLFTKTMTATANGDNDFNGIISSPNRYIRRIHFATDKMEKLEIKRDGREEGEFHTDIMKYVTAQEHKNWQEGHFHYDALLYGFMRDFLLPTQHNSEFYLRVKTTEVVGSIEMLMEEIEKVG